MPESRWHSSWFIASLLLAIPAFAQSTRPILHDISLNEKDGRLVFANSRLSLEFDKSTGQWLALRSKTTPDNLITPIPHPIDFRIDGQWMLGKHSPRFLSHDLTFRSFSIPRIFLARPRLSSPDSIEAGHSVQAGY